MQPVRPMSQREVAVSNFGLLARAVAGRRVDVIEGRSGRTWSDGASIFLGDGGHESLRDVLVVQAALISAGSLAPTHMAGLIGRRRRAARYLALEARRAMRQRGGLAPRAVQERVLEAITGPSAESAAESLRIAGASARVEERPDLLGILRPDRVSGLLAAGLAALARGGKKQLGNGDLPEMPDGDESEAAEESKILKLLSVPGMGDNPISRLLRDFILGLGRRQAGTDGGGAEIPAGPGRSAHSVGEGARAASRPAGLRPVATRDIGLGAQYPEWDWTARAYKADWTAVRDCDPDTSAAEPGLHAARDARLLHQLKRIGTAPQTHRRRSEGESLDLRALVDFAVHRAGGQSADDRVYQSRMQTDHALGVLVLLDASGSTADAAGGSSQIWDEQRRLAANLVQGLEEVGDRVAAYAFRSFGRRDVRFLRLKDFDGRFDGPARARLGALKPAGFTRLGAAIRHAQCRIIAGAGTRQMLLVLISDGIAYEDGYEARYADEDVRKALQEAELGGVGCVCLSIGAVDADAGHRNWGASAHAWLPHAGALGPQVVNLFRTALRSAIGRSHGSAMRRSASGWLQMR